MANFQKHFILIKKVILHKQINVSFSHEAWLIHGLKAMDHVGHVTNSVPDYRLFFHI